MFQNLFIYIINCSSMHQLFLGLKLFEVWNFGVYSDFVHRFSTEVDFSTVFQGRCKLQIILLDNFACVRIKWLIFIKNLRKISNDQNLKSTNLTSPSPTHVDKRRHLANSPSPPCLHSLCMAPKTKNDINGHALLCVAMKFFKGEGLQVTFPIICFFQESLKQM